MPAQEGKRAGSGGHSYCFSAQKEFLKGAKLVKLQV
jgi:hypothetical protein